MVAVLCPQNRGNFIALGSTQSTKIFNNLLSEHLHETHIAGISQHAKFMSALLPVMVISQEKPGHARKYGKTNLMRLRFGLWDMSSDSV